MLDESTDSRPREIDLEATEQTILQMLLSGDPRGVCWRADIELEIGDSPAVSDALGNLRRSGLIHVQGEMVAVTRAAFRTNELLI
jgi:hypothetical protein